MSTDGNLEKYNAPEVVAYYARLTGLQPCEEYLFARYLTPGMAILDMGVGGGRTTPYLSCQAGRYVGADYSKAMVDTCRRMWPDLEFHHCDATDMTQFVEGEFDAVVFSFNGIDVIGSDEDRARCLAETARVLKPGGIFIFSSHNARVVGIWPKLKGARGHQILWRILRSLVKSPSIAMRMMGSGAYTTGEGYVRDPVHGGMRHYVSTPETIAPQLAQAGLTILEAVGGHFPEVRAHALTPWHYYVCRVA